MARCAAKSKRTGKQCQRPAMDGSRVCYHHGGASPKGIASATFKTGRYSKYMPERLLQRYQESVDDPELLNLRAEIALVEARLSDLLTRVDTGEAGVHWVKARKANDDIRRSLLNEDYGHIMEASLELDRIIGAELTDIEAWGQIHSIIEQRRKLVESEQKRLVGMQQMVTSEQAMTLIAAVLSAVKENVPDRAALTAIQARIVEITGSVQR